MNEVVKICKKHGKLDQKDIRLFVYKGYMCKQCLICNREYDRTRYQTSEKRREYEKNRKAHPKYRERIKQYEKNYKDRRRVVNRELYHRKKDDNQYKEKCKIWRGNGYKRSKERMDDSYIKKMLRIYKDATPEMIENKRNQILEFRKIREESKLKKKHKKKLIEDTIKDRETRGVLKICKIHGELFDGDVYFAKNGKKTDKKFYFCRACSREDNVAYYQKNINIIRERLKNYRIKNKDAVKKRHKKWLDRMPDAYIVRFFVKDTKINRDNIPPDLIEMKRELLRLKRIVKERMRAENN